MVTREVLVGPFLLVKLTVDCQDDPGSFSWSRWGRRWVRVPSVKMETPGLPQEVASRFHINHTACLGLPRAAVTNHHKLGHLKQQKFTVSQSRRPEVQN